MLLFCYYIFTFFRADVFSAPYCTRDASSSRSGKGAGHDAVKDCPLIELSKLAGIL
jgi:hypothetical protein